MNRYQRIFGKEFKEEIPPSTNEIKTKINSLLKRINFNKLSGKELINLGQELINSGNFIKQMGGFVYISDEIRSFVGDIICYKIDNNITSRYVRVNVVSLSENEVKKIINDLLYSLWSISGDDIYILGEKIELAGKILISLGEKYINKENKKREF